MTLARLFADLPEEERALALNLLRVQIARRRRRSPVLPAPVSERKEKRCPRCDTVKDVEDFGVSRTRPDGRQGFCRLCRRR